ncbi:MAG: hypothetical protein J3R72DRAFT_479302 [Linnemannia gamsii]|nr:MAG: hypothetical protein J3R72DRAFT_479302 [Linnemannia gamsii]
MELTDQEYTSPPLSPPPSQSPPPSPSPGDDKYCTTARTIAAITDESNTSESGTSTQESSPKVLRRPNWVCIPDKMARRAGGFKVCDLYKNLEYKDEILSEMVVYKALEVLQGVVFRDSSLLDMIGDCSLSRWRLLDLPIEVKFLTDQIRPDLNSSLEQLWQCGEELHTSSTGIASNRTSIVQPRIRQQFDT